MSLLAELRRRNVFRVGAAYAVAAWLLVQIADVLLETFAAPSWAMQTLLLFLAVGFVVALILAWAFEMTPDGLAKTHAAETTQDSVPTRRSSDIVLGLVVIAVIYLMADQLLFRPDSDFRGETQGPAAFSAKPARLTLKLPEGAALAVDLAQPAIAISPDGSRIAYVAYADGARRLYLHSIADGTVQRISGSDNAVMPFFSADGESLAFAVGDRYRYLSASGGIPVTGASATGGDVGRGVAWISGDTAVHAASSNGSLEVRPVSADVQASATESDDSVAHIWPSPLPDPNLVLFTDNTAGELGEAVVSVFSLSDNSVTPLFNGGSGQQYSSSGHIVYGREGSLYTRRFDAAAPTVAGENEVLLLHGVLMNAAGATQFAMAQDGTLAYVEGTLEQADEQLVLVDRDGNATVLFDQGGEVEFPRLSPSGALLAITRPSGATFDVWTLDLRRNNLPQRWTEHFGEDFGAAWAPDSRRLAIASEIGGEIGDFGPLLAVVDGPGRPPERLLDRTGPGEFDIPADWSPDGRYLLYTQYSGRQLDLYTYDWETAETAPYVATEYRETAARFSPNGRWVAYISDSSGELEVYVDAFPEPGGPIRVSIDGGDEPAWSPRGDELFYRNGDDVLSVLFAESDEPEPETPELLFSGRYSRAEGDDQAHFDVAADGDHFYLVRRANEVLPTEIEIVLNWPAALGVE